MSSAKNASRCPNARQRPALSLEEQAEHDAAQLDAVAVGALAVGRDVLVRAAAARRLARQLRALAALSRDAVA